MVFTAFTAHWQGIALEDSRHRPLFHRSRSNCTQVTLRMTTAWIRSPLWTHWAVNASPRKWHAGSHEPEIYGNLVGQPVSFWGYLHPPRRVRINWVKSENTCKFMQVYCICIGPDETGFSTHLTLKCSQKLPALIPWTSETEISPGNWYSCHGKHFLQATSRATNQKSPWWFSPHWFQYQTHKDNKAQQQTTQAVSFRWSFFHSWHKQQNSETWESRGITTTITSHHKRHHNHHNQPFCEMFLWNRKVTLLALLRHSPTRLPNDDMMAQLQRLDQWSWCSHRHCHPTLTWCGGSQRILPRQRSKLCQCPWLLPSRDLSRLRIQAILFQTGKAVQQFSGQKKNSGAILDRNKWPLKKLLIVYFLGWMILNLPNIDLHPFRATIPGTATASMPGVLQVPKRPRAGTGPWRWCQVTVQRPWPEASHCCTKNAMTGRIWEVGTKHFLLFTLDWSGGSRDFAYGYWLISVSHNSFGSVSCEGFNILVDLRYPI